VALCPSGAQAQGASDSGPFGLRFGMTRDEVLQLVGKGAIKSEKDDTLRLTAVPRAHPDFEEYVLVFSPQQGLLKIVAAGKTIQTNGYGRDVQLAFGDIRDAISKNYGAAKTLDNLRSGSIWDEPREWMMGLLKRERTLAAVWESDSARALHLSGIVLEAYALSTEKGYLKISYEFEGWDKYVDSLKAKAGTVF
jgi:hypothetical protein